MKSQVNDGTASERELKSKMSYLLHLPTLGNIKKEADRYRCVLNADSIREREARKARIMEQFGSYMNAELKGNPKPSMRRRTNTIQ